MTECAYCRKPFTPATHNAKYDTPKCKRMAENGRKRQARSEQVSQAGMLSRSRWSSVPDGRFFFWPDTHVGYADKRACQVALNAVNIFKPTTLVILGDFLDMEGPSRFPSKPSSSHGERLQRDLNEAKEMLRTIKEAAGEDCRLFFLEGNHEARLEKFAMSQAAPLWGLNCLKVEELLELKEMGYEYSTYDEPVELAPGFITVHGKMISKHSGWSAQKEADRWQVSGASGHTHRLGIYQQTTFDSYKFWMECGYLGQMDVPGADATSNWQVGFGCVVIENGQPYPSTHRIVDGRTLVDGRIVRA